ncbi:stemmadenine O-acetyltransferase-like [Rosa sericea]
MEVTIISRDSITPAATSSSVHRHKKPYQLSIIDQLFPITYAPLVLFYPIIDPNINVSQTLAHLKNSLSYTLVVYYPFSGRIKNNLCIDDFDAGVPYLEARINCRMFEFLKLPEIELLNQFVPFHPFCQEAKSHDDRLPLLALQVSVFSCGGIAIGVSGSHKIFDGATANNFLKSWAAVFRGDHDKTLLHTNLYQASLSFPAKDDIPEKYLAFTNSMLFKGKRYMTRRFVFNAKAIDNLRDKAKSEVVPNPTSIETLTCFLWKHATAASRYGSTSRRASIVAHAVNIRPQLKLSMLDNAIGNIFWWAIAANIPTNKGETCDDDQLCDLMKLLHESIKGLDNDYLKTLQGEEGFGAISEFIDRQLEVMYSLKPETYIFTSWTKIFKEVDFGWGRPFWIGVMGKVGPTLGNLTVFVETQWGKGIEAWVTLEEKQMAVMEKDPQFLAFTSPNPHISSM